jgi:hypothetical protein
MLPGEYAVVTSTSDGSRISLFAPERFVEADKGLMLITILDRRADKVLVSLPATSLERGSRTVTVAQGELVDR